MVSRACTVNVARCRLLLITPDPKQDGPIFLRSAVRSPCHARAPPRARGVSRGAGACGGLAGASGDGTVEVQIVATPSKVLSCTQPRFATCSNVTRKNLNKGVCVTA